MYKFEVVLDHFMGEPTPVKGFHTKQAALKYVADQDHQDAFCELSVRPTGYQRLRTSLPRLKSTIQRIKQ